MEKEKRRIKLIILLLIIIAALLVFTVVSDKKNEEIKAQKATEELTEEEKEQKEVEEVAVLSEGERVRQYISEYISNVEDKNYGAAYEMLYSEFKSKYFPTIESYEQYIKTKYPKVISLSYEKIDRQGTYYVSTINIKDSLYDEKNFTQMFVLKEEDANRFQLSFQAE